MRQSRSGKLVGVPLREHEVKLIPRRAGAISSLSGAKTNLKAKKALFETFKKKLPHNKLPYQWEFTLEFDSEDILAS